MAKRKSASYMTPGEQIAGTVFFVIYLVVLPFATAPLFRLAERLLDASISPSLQNAIYYYTLFAVTFIPQLSGPHHPEFCGQFRQRLQVDLSGSHRSVRPQ